MNHSRRAFTLIEVLLALSIFSVVAVCVYGTFWAGVKLNQRSEGENAAYHQIRIALELMSVDLENAAPYDFSGSYPGQSAFSGEPDAVTFLLPSGKGLKVVRYHLDLSRDGKVHKVIVGARQGGNIDAVVDHTEQHVRSRDLIREEWDLVDYLSGVTGEDHVTEIIATNVGEDSLKFFYGYAVNAAGSEDNPAEDTYEWRGEWKEGGIPSLVRVEMDFLLTGPAQRMISMSKDVFIPHGSLGKPEKM